MQDTYAWLFADYTWKHTYTPAVAAFLAKEQITAEAAAAEAAAAEAAEAAAAEAAAAEAATAEAATTTGISQCQVPPVTSAGVALSAGAATARPLRLPGKFRQTSS